jgi:hypothetical protein
MKPTPIEHAVGALKLASLHADHPSVVSAETLREASAEAIGHLQGIPTVAIELGKLYADLLDVLPSNRLPFVTLTLDRERPYAALITTLAGQLVDVQFAPTCTGLVELIKSRQPQPAGRGEAA